MKRRDLVFVFVLVALSLWCARLYKQVAGLERELDTWESSRFEIRRKLFLLDTGHGPTSGLNLSPRDIFRLNLLNREGFTDGFLQISARLHLATLMLERERLRDADEVRDIENSPDISGDDINIPDNWPTQGTVTSLFGLRKHPIYDNLRFHSGVDIANLKNTEVLAAAGGLVSFAGRDGGYGNVVILDHGNGFESLYGHAEDILVSAGDVVKKGQLIASMGSTGVATGEHLHYEIRFAGDAVDPTAFVK